MGSRYLPFINFRHSSHLRRCACQDRIKSEYPEIIDAENHVLLPVTPMALFSCSNAEASDNDCFSTPPSTLPTSHCRVPRMLVVFDCLQLSRDCVTCVVNSSSLKGYVKVRDVADGASWFSGF